ncbi:PREDICTED: tetratricopeptide repeat protein 31 isoform X2 [Thamnophis sirtalis]|uniref:Tetratricopeptide repeat protein 31 isoform X2 n=1 Tax=Thamnophis sirtalis TaxID=35019 RepID=A0A6I9X422_9SAUR|nr:PREDICTED: tetratricopeptide repeat protein 31 isoform X2 [Thamnophis sirtalis]
MERLAVGEGEEEEEEEEEEGERPVRRRQQQRGQPYPYLNAEPYWYSVINYATYEDWEDSSEEAEENDDSEEAQDGPYATFCGFQRAFLCPPSASLPPLSSRLDVTLLGFALPQKPQLTAEEAERNAELLVAEEERLKKKAERKRMRKKRQKDRKRQEKRTLELKAKSEANKSPAGQDEGTLDDGIPDSEGSFNEASPGGSPSRSLEEEEAAEKPPELQLTPVEQSLVLADCGNETAKEGLFHEAVRLFTEAIKLNPQEYRLFGNRSFCYEKLQSHVEALRDAQSALSLRPGWPKGLFRQGKALLGLKQYTAAARTFQQLLPLDGFCGDAALQLQKCQTQLSLERRLGCSRCDRDLLPVETQLPLPAARGAAVPRRHCPGHCHCPAGTSGYKGPSQVLRLRQLQPQRGHRNRLRSPAGGGSGRTPAHSAAEAPRTRHRCPLQGGPRHGLSWAGVRAEITACTEVLGGPGPSLAACPTGSCLPRRSLLWTGRPLKAAPEGTGEHGRSSFL